MQTSAIVLEKPGDLAVQSLALSSMGPGDILVDVEWSGISAGTERLLWDGRMPDFPGMGYPLVPGYESVGRVVAADGTDTFAIGQPVFVPGARCFGPVRGLFGGAARRLVVPSQRAIPIDEDLADRGTLLALAATAFHVIAEKDGPKPDLIVGHGALGRLLARLVILEGATAPVVWERQAHRRQGAANYAVIDPTDDDRHDYRCVVDVSGDPGILDTLISRLAPNGEVILAGFYDRPLSFNFPPAFMREARLRIAAQWRESDLKTVARHVRNGMLSLEDLITHHSVPQAAALAYQTAFTDPECLKMVIDWRTFQ